MITADSAESRPTVVRLSTPRPAMGHFLGVPIDNDRLAAACRLFAEYGCWPQPVPAGWDPLA